MSEMTCQELVELVTEYLEGTLPANEAARFEDHLADCPHCRVYLDQMRHTIGALGRLPRETVPPAVLDELVGYFRTWKTTPQR